MIRPRLIVLLAVQNIHGQGRRSALLCGLLALVALIAVVGAALVDSIERGMRRTIVESLAGELQVLPATSLDRLSYFGDVYFGDTRHDRVADAGALATRLRGVEGVDEVVPLAIRLAAFTQPSPMDAAVENLRSGLERGDARATADAREHLLAAGERLARHLEKVDPEALAPGDLERRRSILERVRSAELWETLGTAPSTTLMFLDASFAPLFGESTPLYLHLTGTDVASFARAFARFDVVRGRMVEEDEPAFMVAEDIFKSVRHPYQVRLDQLADFAERQPEALPAARVAGLVEAAPALVDHLTPSQEAQLRQRLCQQVTCAAGGSLLEALQRYADVDRDTVQERRRYFDEVAMEGMPRGLLVLGREYVGSMADDTGQPRSTVLELVGTYRFRGLEEVPVSIPAITNASTFSRIDDPSRRVKEPTKAGAEEPAVDAALTDDLFFSDDAPPVAGVDTGGFDEFEAWTGANVDAEAPPFELDAWPAHSIAVRLSPTAPSGARAALEQLVTAHGERPFVVVDGFEVAGPIGQAVPILKGIFTGVVLLLLLLAFGVIANALVLSWLRRIPELGTLRALGATRGVVAAALMTEALLLGALGGVIGVSLGAAALLGFAAWGIPAPAPIFEFIFGGPRLHPVVGAGPLVLGSVVILLALLASVYPAWRATRATPREAMEANR